MRLPWGTGRDNPIESDEELRRFFERLRGDFRDTVHRTLVIWPVSQKDTANRLYSLAVDVGSDSLVGDSKSYYSFPGPDRSKFYTIADNTCRLMNREQSLAEFGIDEELGSGVLSQAETIAQYFQKMLDHWTQLNDKVGTILTQKPRPRVWVLLPGDETTAVMATVNQLTSGAKRKLDIPALTTDLAKELASAQYMKDWAHLGRWMPFILRSLDVRVVEIPPNLALSIIRAFGDVEIRSKLKQQHGATSAAIDALRESMLGELLLDADARPRRAPRRTEENTSDEFIRVQAAAKGNDALLNAPFAKAIEKLGPSGF